MLKIYVGMDIWSWLSMFNEYYGIGFLNFLENNYNWMCELSFKFVLEIGGDYWDILGDMSC